MSSTSIIANGLLVISFLMNTLYVSGMEKESQLLVSSCDKKNSCIDIVKDVLALGSTCKSFNKNKDLYVAFGKFCKDRYSMTEKNEVMSLLSLNTGRDNYWEHRYPLFILVHATNWYSRLFLAAIEKNDKEMLTEFFKNGANPNQKYDSWEPDWFSIRDIDTVKMFIAQEVDLHGGRGAYLNVLWYSIACDDFSPQLIDFYLKNNVDARGIDRDGNCILHRIAIYSSLCLNPVSCDDYEKITKLFVKAAPELIDIKNNKGKTPLKFAYDKLDDSFTDIKGGRILAVIRVIESYGPAM